MTDELPTRLGAITAALKRLNRQVLLRSLQQGLPADVVRSPLRAAGLTSTSELDALYSWRDGTSTVGIAAIDDIHLFPGFYLLSLKDALENYRAFGSDSRWSPAWLPLFANGGGDFYLLELNSSGESPVRHFRIDEAEHPIEFGSLRALLMTVAAAFERGVIVVDSDGYLEMDDLVFGGLAAELNPEIAWWRG